MTLEEFLPPDPDLSADDIAMYTEEFARLQALPEPTTIDELIEWNGAEGTSTILDMEHISPEPCLGTLSPLSGSELLSIFGTQQPSHSQVKQAIQQQQINLPEREQGIYIVVYQEGLPDELCFIGVSGD